MEVPFVITKESIRTSKDPSLAVLFDRLALRAQDLDPLLPEVTGDGDLLYSNGWQEEHTHHLVETAPRTLWLLARAKLVPLDETMALRLIRDAGVALEPLPIPVAKIRHFDASSSTSLLLSQISRRNPTPRNRPVETKEVRIVTIGGEDQ